MNSRKTFLRVSLCMPGTHLLLISVVYRLKRPYCVSRVNHDWKIRNRRQRMDIRKCSFISRTIQLWNKLPLNSLGNFPFKPSTFRKRVRKVISEVKCSEGNSNWGGNRVFPVTGAGIEVKGIWSAGKSSIYREKVRKVLSGEGNLKYGGSQVFPRTGVGMW
jgi:hypothetical protein